jgi:hypothetical protein
MAGEPAFAVNLGREQFRGFVPDKTYHMTLARLFDEQTLRPQRGLRIEAPETLVGRPLGLKSRPMETSWVEGTIEELFAGKDKAAKGVHITPLVIQSVDYAAIAVER